MGMKRRTVIVVTRSLCVLCVVLLGLVSIIGSNDDPAVDSSNDPSQSFGLHGTFTYADDTLVLEINETTFPSDAGLPVGTEIFAVTSFSDQSMTWTNERYEEISWTRQYGTFDQIIGAWDGRFGGYRYSVYFHEDGTFFMLGARG